VNSKTSVRRSIATEVAEKLLGGAATSPGPKPNEIKEDANMMTAEERDRMNQVNRRIVPAAGWKLQRIE